MTDEIHYLSVAQAGALIRKRKLSPVELTTAYLERIETFDPQLNAFITVTPELALKQARRAEREIVKGNYRGPLHGI
ncbi:MAG TPA: amidase family protein, partial [Burkholderiales bacterium]|nr:amidase family protein [Burkholderiales bacterium]